MSSRPSTTQTTRGGRGGRARHNARGGSSRGGRRGGPDLGSSKPETEVTPPASSVKNRVHFHLTNDTIEVWCTHTIDPLPIQTAVGQAAAFNRMYPKPKDLDSQFQKLVNTAQNGKWKKNWLVQSVMDESEWEAIKQDEALYPAVSAADPTRAFLTRKQWRDAQALESNTQVRTESDANEAAESQPHTKSHLTTIAYKNGTIAASSTGPIDEKSAIGSGIEEFVRLNSMSMRPRNSRQLYINAVMKMQGDPSVKDWQISVTNDLQQYTKELEDQLRFSVLSPSRPTKPAYTKEEADTLDH
jgi:hypothetical protein